MRIVQITDIHIGAEDEDTRDIDVRGNFPAILEMAEHLHPDYLVLTGDLCFSTGNAEAYYWIKVQMDQLALPFDIIPGNHDDTALMARIFEREHLLLPNGEMAFSRTLAGIAFLFLDTAAGVLSETQGNWLSDKLNQLSGPQIIFMHHPPLRAGVPFMDNNYPLQNPEVFQQAIQGYASPIHVFCGHYHVEKSIHHGSLSVHVTPSTFFQIDQFSERFAVDHYRPALRVIDLSGDGRLLHTVRYLDVAGW